MKKSESAYNPQEVEENIYKFWEENNYFHGEVKIGGRPFSVVIPPPNITGILHMGHVMDNTPQDIIIRLKRMQGFETTWVPGTDHAGIATQNAVEKKLAAENIKRDDLGRYKFIERVWQWKEQYGGTIINQLKRLGCSCDWSRLRFTMDSDYSQSVTEVFCQLYQKGLIYRGNYIINWCPRCQTALSDEEVEHREIEGGLYWIKYSFKNLPGKNDSQNKPPADHILVATTRPETMLGDTAVAVHPTDQRYKNLTGATLTLPLLEREIPLVKDDFADPKFGSGAVKVTPAHDPNDFEIGKRHGLEEIMVIGPDGRMTKAAGPYQGLDRFACRKKVVKDLEEQGLFLKKEVHRHSVGHCYRCETIIEPYLSRQWFIKMKPLAKPAIEAVKKGQVKFFPDRWNKVYMEWMVNIRDWCISRQLWWGHQIPVWYCQKSQKEDTPPCPPIVSASTPKKCPKCKGVKLVRDPDVLDTWFSSWLWPFAVFGWPPAEQKKSYKKHSTRIIKGISSLEYFYPTSWLNAGKDILFFWVARMIMAGLEFTNHVPFRHVYIHGIARDDRGRKLSKSLGNSPDPMDLIARYGADALRFGIMANIPLGGDISLSDDVYASGRNFCNKLWNASRLVLMNLAEAKSPTAENGKGRSDPGRFEDRWILSRLNTTIRDYTRALETYEFSQAAHIIYHFFWGDLCDWYLEMIKPRLYQKEASADRDSVAAILLSVFNNTLRLLHPFVPFITEELWQKFKKTTNHESFNRPVALIKAVWPEVDPYRINKTVEKNMSQLIDIIRGVRDIRNKMNIDARKPLAVFISAKSKNQIKLIKDHLDLIKQMAFLGEVTIGMRLTKPPHSATAVLDEADIFVPLEGIIDLEVEKKRLANRLKKIREQLMKVKGKLDSHEFRKKAPATVVKKERQRLDDLTTQVNKLNSNLQDLTGPTS